MKYFITYKEWCTGSGMRAMTEEHHEFVTTDDMEAWWEEKTREQDGNWRYELTSVSKL